MSFNEHPIQIYMLNVQCSMSLLCYELWIMGKYVYIKRSAVDLIVNGTTHAFILSYRLYALVFRFGFSLYFSFLFDLIPI